MGARLAYKYVSVRECQCARAHTHTHTHRLSPGWDEEASGPSGYEEEEREKTGRKGMTKKGEEKKSWKRESKIQILIQFI